MSRFDAKINFLQIQTFKNKLPTNPNFFKKNCSQFLKTRSRWRLKNFSRLEFYHISFNLPTSAARKDLQVLLLRKVIQRVSQPLLKPVKPRRALGTPKVSPLQRTLPN